MYLSVCACTLTHLQSIIQPSVAGGTHLNLRCIHLHHIDRYSSWIHMITGSIYIESVLHVCTCHMCAISLAISSYSVFCMHNLVCIYAFVRCWLTKAITISGRDRILAEVARYHLQPTLGIIAMPTPMVRMLPKT